MRSPTAADLVANWPGFETDFAGLSADADEVVSTEHIEWADAVIVMDRRQKKLLQQRYPAPLRHISVRVLDVPDRYGHMDAELIAMITPRLKRLLRPVGA